MNRKKKFELKKVEPDLKYQNVYVSKLINKVMKGGKKIKAIKIVYDALEKLEQKFENSIGSNLLTSALEIIKPNVYLRSKRIASRVYHVPIPISHERALKRSIFWLIKGAKKRKEYKFQNNLYNELLDILQDKKGESLKIRDDYHRVAKDNEAFIHYI